MPLEKGISGIAVRYAFYIDKLAYFLQNPPQA